MIKKVLKTQIQLTAVNKKCLNLYLHFLLRVLKYIGLKVSLLSLPKKRSRITLLTAPHVYKKFKEHFDLYRYKAILDFHVFPKILKFLILNKPSSIRIKLHAIKKKIT